MELNKRTVRTIALLAAGCILLYWALQNHKALMDLINWVTGLLLSLIHISEPTRRS